jgi:hypothetical protein
MLLIESDFDDAKLVMEEERATLHGPSKRHCTFIRRDCLQVEKDLFCKYFAEQPLYPHKYFRRRFQMSRLFFFLVFKMQLKLKIFILSNEKIVLKDTIIFPSEDHCGTHDACIWCYR